MSPAAELDFHDTNDVDWSEVDKLTFFADDKYFIRCDEVEGKELPPPKDPFNPGDDEDFIHRLFGLHPRRAFFFESDFVNLAMDSKGRNVFVIAVEKTSEQLKVFKLLTSSSHRKDPRNHTIPVLEIISGAGRYDFVIEAAWAEHWFWPTTWPTKEDTKNVVRQLLEGLAYMHELRIAHGDINLRNIVWNHEDQRMTEGETFPPFPFAFAFIDFECAQIFEKDQPSRDLPPCRPPSDIAAPEQLLGEAYDLFPADVYNLGKVFQQTFIPQDHELADLVKEMTLESPEKRPTAVQALSRANEV